MLDQHEQVEAAAEAAFGDLSLTHHTGCSVAVGVDHMLVHLCSPMCWACLDMPGTVPLAGAASAVGHQPA